MTKIFKLLLLEILSKYIFQAIIINLINETAYEVNNLHQMTQNTSDLLSLYSDYQNYHEIFIFNDFVNIIDINAEMVISQNFTFICKTICHFNFTFLGSFSNSREIYFSLENIQIFSLPNQNRKFLNLKNSFISLKVIFKFFHLFIKIFGYIGLG